MLDIDFDRDVKRLLLEQFKKAGYQFNATLPTINVVRQYLNLLFREISADKRTVHLSRELATVPPSGNLKLAFDSIMDAAAKGRSLNWRLSSKILDPDYKDPLLYDWRIHHLHLGLGTDGENSKFAARTSNLLYVRVEPQDFFCIQILDHDPINGFANKSLLQIIHDNWPHLLASYRFVNLPQPSGNLTNQEIHDVRKAGALTFVSVKDGTAYMPVGGGYASDGSSIEVTRNADWLLGRIRRVEAAIKGDESNVRSQISQAIGRCPPTIKFSLQSWDEMGILVTERKTKTQLRFKWKA